MGRGAQRLPWAPTRGQSYEPRKPQSSSPPVSSPSWLPAFGPAASRSGQRGVARMDGPASTDASARTCRKGIAEMSGQGTGLMGSQGPRLK